jgi:mono/diheme cytochrome c family protein
MKSVVLVLAAAMALRGAGSPAGANRLRAGSTSESRSNPYAGNADAVAAGRKLFRNECAQCHGAEAVGSAKAPSLRSRRVQEAPDDALFKFLTNGKLRHGMPSWSRLPEERRWQIVAYLKSL